MLGNVGKFTYGTEHLSIHTAPDVSVHLGAFCSVAENVTVMLGSNHRTDWVSTYPFGHVHQGAFPSFSGVGHPSSKGDVLIGNDVWIARGVTIMSGVTIGNGVVIAANSHVVKNIPDYAIVGGNPAKVIKMRFSDSQIADLLEVAWWAFSDEDINELSSSLCSTEIDEFIEKGLRLRRTKY